MKTKFIAKNETLKKFDLNNILEEKICSIGIEFVDGEKFELRWDANAQRLILWTEHDLILKCKSGNTVIINHT